MKQQYNFTTNWGINNSLFFFNKEEKQKHCYVWLKIVFTILSFLFFSSKNIYAQCTLSCNNQTNITLDAIGQFIITPATVLSNPACNPNDFSIQITDAQGNVVNNPVDCAYLNQNLTANLISNIDGNSCWGTILVKDNLAPFIQCQDKFIFCFENANPDNLGYPIASDNCTNCLLYTSPSPRDQRGSRMPSSA